MRDENAHASKVIFPKKSPQRLIEPTDAIVGIRCRLPVRDPVEEMTIISTLLPYTFHLGGAWLEVSKVLLPQPRFFINLYSVSRERRRRRVIGCERREYAFCGLACSTVWRSKKMEGIIWPEQRAESASSFKCLILPLWGEFDLVIGDGLVDF